MAALVGGRGGAAQDCDSRACALRSFPALPNMLLPPRRREHGCQPNFRRRVRPDPATSCGPYKPDTLQPSLLQPGGRALSGSRGGGSTGAPEGQTGGWPSESGSHDTIAMVAVTAGGSVAAGASSNGAIHKVPGRVGDAAVPGGGAYADSAVGGCGSTGKAGAALVQCGLACGLGGQENGARHGRRMGRATRARHSSHCLPSANRLPFALVQPLPLQAMATRTWHSCPASL